MASTNQPQEIRKEAIDESDAVKCKEVIVQEQNGTLYIAIAEPAPGFLDLGKGDVLECVLDTENQAVFYQQQ